jgi:hypothetical protein
MAEGVEEQAPEEEESRRRDAQELLLHKENDGRRPKARIRMVHLYVKHEPCPRLAERKLPLRNGHAGRRGKLPPRRAPRHEGRCPALYGLLICPNNYVGYVSQLHTPKPLRYCPGVESHACAHSERRDSPRFCQLENSYARHGEQFSQLSSSESAAIRFNVVSQGFCFGHGRTPGVNSRRTPLLAVPRWPGGHVGCFSLAVPAGSPIPMAPLFGLLSSKRCADPSPHSFPVWQPMKHCPKRLRSWKRDNACGLKKASDKTGIISRSIVCI